MARRIALKPRSARDWNEMLDGLSVQIEAVWDEVKETSGAERRRARDYHKRLVRLYNSVVDELNEANGDEERGRQRAQAARQAGKADPY